MRFRSHRSTDVCSSTIARLTSIWLFTSSTVPGKCACQPLLLLLLVLSVSFMMTAPTLCAHYDNRLLAMITSWSQCSWQWSSLASFVNKWGQTTFINNGGLGLASYCNWSKNWRACLLCMRTSSKYFPGMQKSWNTGKISYDFPYSSHSYDCGLSWQRPISACIVRSKKYCLENQTVAAFQLHNAAPIHFSC